MALQKIALQPIRSHIENKWGPRAMSKQQINALAERALESYRVTSGCSSRTIKAKLLSQDHAWLHQTLDSLIKSPATPWQHNLLPKSSLEAMIFSYIKGNSPLLKDLFTNRTLLKSFFLSPDPKLMKEARSAIQTIYCDIWRSIQENPPQTKAQHFHYDTLIGDLAAFLAYQNAIQNEVMQIPVRVGQTWQMASYMIDKLPLTPPCLGSPIVAFGFRPITKDVPPLLLFKGTTRPADDGSGLSLLTDINPGGSVGAYAFHFGKKTIHKWLKSNTSSQKAITFGTSLGGAHAWRCALHFPDMVQEVRAFCPPGFSFTDLKKLKKIQKLETKPKIRLFCQYNDPVHYIDLPASKGVKYYEILGEKIKTGVGAHTALYCLHDKSVILRMEPHVIKSPWKRVALTATKIALTVFLFLPLLLIHMIQTGFHSLAHACARITISKN